jgi:hypothetical protein
MSNVHRLPLRDLSDAEYAELTEAEWEARWAWVARADPEGFEWFCARLFGDTDADG